MGKKVADDVLDGAWLVIKNSCNLMTVCEGEPADFAEATTNKGTGTNKKLADVAMAPADFTIADGDVNGRKISVAAKPAVDVDVTGTGDHVALLDTVGSRLLYVTTTTAAANLDAAGTTDVPAWDAELADPA